LDQVKPLSIYGDDPFTGATYVHDEQITKDNERNRTVAKLGVYQRC